MATIKLKSSNSAGNVPSSLEPGEVAICTRDGNWFYGDASSTVKNDFMFGTATVTGNTVCQGTLIVTGKTTMANTLSATTSVKVGNGDGLVSAATISAPTVTGTLSTAAQTNITAVGIIGTGVWASNRTFTMTESGVVGNYQGDIVTFGSEVSLTIGTLYYYNGTTWVTTDANAVSTSTTMLGIAIGSTPADGVLIRGMVTLASAPGGSDGDVIYVSETAGRTTATAPSTPGAIVRALGYVLDATDNKIWFNPDNTWVELS